MYSARGAAPPVTVSDMLSGFSMNVQQYTLHEGPSLAKRNDRKLGVYHMSAMLSGFSMTVQQRNIPLLRVPI